MEVRSLWVVWSHMHYRGGSCSEFSCLRSKEVLSFTSFVTSELMNPGVYGTHLFSLCHEMCGSSLVTLRNFVFVAILGIPLHLLCLLTLAVHPFLGCNWLFFLVTCQYQTCHCQIGQSETWLSVSGSSIMSTISFAFGPCHFEREDVSS
jgi:hypothetical protein